MDGLYIVNLLGDVVMERQWLHTDRSVVESFLEALRFTEGKPEEISPVIETSKYYIFNVFRHNLFFLAPAAHETSPLLMIELLNRIVRAFEDYLGADFAEDKLRDHFVLVYEILDEMLDEGEPFNTETSILKEIVLPPTLSNRVRSALTGKGNITSNLPETGASVVWWRSTGIKHSSNNIYFDFIEDLDAILDSSGALVSSEISGRVECNSQLSGMPDVIVSFENPRILKDCSFHPCVRYMKYENERVVSFIPPDGRFELMTYSADCQGQMPLFISPQISFGKGPSGGLQGRLNIVINPRATKTLEEVSLIITLPSEVVRVECEPSTGKWKFDGTLQEIRWDIGKISSSQTLSGNMSLRGDDVPESVSLVRARFRVPQVALSGLKIDSVNVTREEYKSYKGVRYLTRGGNYQVRCG